MGSVVTLDAIHCNKETCHEIVENAGGHYFVGVKENQKRLLAGIRNTFANSAPEDSDTCKETGHGRRETRAVHTISAGDSLGLPNVKTVVKVERRRETVRSGKILDSSMETSYAVTSIPAERLTAKMAGELARGHWGIENRLHHTKDASMLEDRYRANNGLARIMAALRSIATLVLAPLKTTTILAMRRMACNIHKAIRFLTCKSLNEFRLYFLK